MVKHYRKSANRSNKSNKSKSHKKNFKTNRRMSLKNMRGGDDGRYVMPPSYYGNGTAGYYAPGSPELASSGNQVSVSQGTVWQGGQYAGPNLYPMQGGFGCGCSSKKNKKFKNKSKSQKNKSKSRKTKSKSRQH